jgi:hypothetical protein
MRVHPGRGFIQKKKFRLRYESASDFQPPPVGIRKGFGKIIQTGPQPIFEEG